MLQGTYETTIKHLEIHKTLHIHQNTIINSTHIILPHPPPQKKCLHAPITLKHFPLEKSIARQKRSKRIDFAEGPILQHQKIKAEFLITCTPIFQYMLFTKGN